MSKTRNCASCSLFKSPVAPTATRFKYLYFSVDEKISKPRIFASGSLFKSPVAPTATRFKHFCAREAAGNFFGAHFPNKLAQMTAPVNKKRGPGTLQPQSTAVKLNQTQPPVPAKVVFGPRLGTTLLHAPGTKMT